MPRSKSILALAVFTLTVNAAHTGDPTETNRSKFDPRWIGAWEISQAGNRLLGFTDAEGRVDAVYDHPKSFQISFDKVLGEKIGQEKLEVMRSYGLNRINQRLVATGKWETKFDVDPGIETDCYVMQHEGSTYLWVGAPYIALYGGKVSFLQGADHEHDLMVIDFYPLPVNSKNRGRTADTVVYKRASK